MNNPVLYHLRRQMHTHGGLTLSFNFRGVGLSAGTFSGGWGEREDTQRVMAYFRREYPDLPLHLFGYSFGALVALETAREESVESLVLVGFPLTSYFRYPDRTQAKRVILFQGEKDEFGTPEQVRDVFGQTLIQAQVVSISASNHFFENHLEDLMRGFARIVYGG